MIETTQSPRERTAGGGGLGAIFGDGLGGHGLATVSSGLHVEQLPVANMTVGAIRTRFRDRFDIDPHSQAVVAGHEVGDETVVRPGQLLMFMRRAGEKGVARRALPLIKVASGLYVEELAVANMTVGEIRARFRKWLDIDPRSQAVLAGHEVGEEAVVHAGQLLIFARRSGEMGG